MSSNIQRHSFPRNVHSFRCPVQNYWQVFGLHLVVILGFPIVPILQVWSLLVWRFPKILSKFVISPSLPGSLLAEPDRSCIPLLSPQTHCGSHGTHTLPTLHTHTALTSVFRREGVGRLSCLVSAKLFFLQVSSRLDGFLRNVRSRRRSLETDFCQTLDPPAGRRLGIWHSCRVRMLALEKLEHLLASVEDLCGTGLLDTVIASASYLRLWPQAYPGSSRTRTASRNWIGET